MDETPAGYFYVDKNGRTYWSQSKDDDKSGPDIEIETPQSTHKSQAKSTKKSVKQSTQGEQTKVQVEPSSTDASHLLTSIETTEEFLKANGIAFKTVRHPVTMTNAEMPEVIHFDGEHEGAALAKQLFLHDKKNKDRMWLVMAVYDEEVDQKALNKYLGVGSGNLRAADLDSLYKYLGCRKGLVNYFSILNDVENKVNVIYDKRLYESKWQSFHPMDNSASTCINVDGVLKIKELTGRDDSNFEIMDFKALKAGGLAPKPAPAPAAKDTAKEQPAAGDKPKKEKKKKEKKPKEEGEGGQQQAAKDKGPKKDKPPKNNDNKPKDNKDKKHEEGIQYQKADDFSMWYQQIITKAELIEYYDVGGCYILRPRSFYIWEKIQGFLDSRFKSAGVQNCYFPMFVTQKALQKEEDHLAGFSPEVAWVTKSGQKDMEEAIAIRPTSETIMYPAYAKWIRSHRDLPMLLNQWSNVVRWEFKHPTPFIRTREFLWQEGHTAHATLEETTAFVSRILEFYATCYEDLLAVPVVRGTKSREETFAGADFSKTTEIYVPISGRGIQGATSHCLGQNFSKMFDIQFEDEKGQKQMAWQASWGYSTRSIGAMIMVHSDDKGLMLPPRVAETQVVVIPVIKTGDDQEAIMNFAKGVIQQLKDGGIRTHLDDRDKNPGNKYNHWELRGIPLRFEVGVKEVANNNVRFAKRNDGQKDHFPIADLPKNTSLLLDQIHDEMYNKALAERLSHQKDVFNWEDFMSEIMKRNICYTPWCGCQECEQNVNDKSKAESEEAMAENEGEMLLTGAAKTLCIPDEQKQMPENAVCFACGKPATTWALWGRTF